MDTNKFQQYILDKVLLCTHHLETWPEFLQGIACNISVKSHIAVHTNSCFPTFLEMFDDFRVGTIRMNDKADFIKQEFIQFMDCDNQYRHLKHIGWILDTNMLLLEPRKEEVYVYDKHTHTVEHIGSFCFFIFNVVFGCKYIPWASSSKVYQSSLLEEVGLLKEVDMIVD